MNRKIFLQRLGGVLISLPILSVIGCGSDDDAAEVTPTDPPVASENCENGAVGTISNNHGHSLTVTTAEVEAGVEKTYTIQGTSGHDHSITLSPANFTTLADGEGLDIDSSVGGGHTHIVTVFCA